MVPSCCCTSMYCPLFQNTKKKLLFDPQFYKYIRIKLSPIALSLSLSLSLSFSHTLSFTLLDKIISNIHSIFLSLFISFYHGEEKEIPSLFISFYLFSPCRRKRKRCLFSSLFTMSKNEEKRDA